VCTLKFEKLWLREEPSLTHITRSLKVCDPRSSSTDHGGDILLSSYLSTSSALVCCLLPAIVSHNAAVQEILSFTAMFKDSER
jgi:hypothetical protein